MGDVTDLQAIAEGEESQVFSFLYEGSYYIVRINQNDAGFKKDEYAYRHFTSRKIPIPQIIKIGYYDNKHAFCISKLVRGITLQDAEPNQITKLLQPLTDAWSAIKQVDITNTNGYGEFDENGDGKFETWEAFLLDVLQYDWKKVASVADIDLIDKLKSELRHLVLLCPKERRLVHGDFGSNNVIVDGGQIKSIIDWENSLYGDPLYDIATAYFWSPWLVCMQMSAEYWGKKLGEIPNYHARIKCYLLRIALHEIYKDAINGNAKMLNWLQKRAEDL